ncbi:MAG: hypothetical protein HXJ92_02600, partial [candidate division SR1 bacterium]|nr:hypothetical protein [candidate division SR1 bacterium]
MKKIRFLLVLGVLSLAFFAGCQQKSGVSSDENSKLDLAGKQVVKLDAFSEKRGSFDGYV